MYKKVGGVAGLKQAPFFAKIDYVKLENKEIDPPYDLNVDNERDLRNFHNDFIEMPLPRSVRDLCKDEHKPQRVASDTFRGFSFIQRSFVLPERDLDEFNTYFRGCDKDGESDSDMASSKCETEAVPQPSPVEPVKKKRPPRKRKKKKKKETPETASIASTVSMDTTPAASYVESEKALPVTINKTQTIACRHDASDSNELAPKTDFVQKQILKEDPSKQTGKLLTSTCQSELKKPNQLAKTKTSQMRNVEAWTSVNVAGKKNRNRVAGYNAVKASQGSTYANIRQQNQPPVSRKINLSPSVEVPPVQNSRSSPAGSWAARLQKSAASSQSFIKSTDASPPPPPDCPPSPSSDWRKHASPQIQRAIRRSSIQTTNKDVSQGVWPSLSEFPLAPGLSLSNKEIPSANAVKKPLQGAWGKR